MTNVKSTTAMMPTEDPISKHREPNPPSVEERRPSSPLRIALVGGGTMARHHARAIARVQDGRVTAIAEPVDSAREEMLEQCEDAAGYATLEELLADRTPDVVHICTPPETHVPMARTALEAGTHVYVEKPFAPTAREAHELLELAAARDLHVCAGHQLLFEAPSRRARDLLPALGSLVHLESYFSFRQVRVARDGRPALPADLQLLDILPHPVYLLLAFLEKAAPDEETELENVSVGREGTVHALVRRGSLTGTLIVTLGGRPVESYLRLIGTNGTLHADYVRGTIQRSIGPGSSGIDKALQPYRVARQMVAGTTAALTRRILKRQKSYPGLLEIFQAFYDAVRSSGAPPLSPENILDTVRLCEQIGEAVRPGETATISPSHEMEDRGGPRVLVTGGTGFLGSAVVDALRERGATVRVLSRRPPPSWDRKSDVEYAVADLGEGLPSHHLRDVNAVIHCAAETSGGWEAHERNSIQATEHLFRATAEAGVSHIVHVSSIAVLTGTEPLHENSPLVSDRSSGPYVWGKAESERLASDLGAKLDLSVHIVRPGAIVNRECFEPPGRLGRRLGNFFIAVGGRSDILGAVDVRDVASILAWMATEPGASPEIVNLIDPQLPSKRDLVNQLRRANPDIRVVWLPHFLLQPLSWCAIAIQKLLRPGKPAIKIAEVFKNTRYRSRHLEYTWQAASLSGSISTMSLNGSLSDQN